MASLVERKNRYYVVYTYENEAGEKKQKWESCKTKADAQRRKSEVEYRQELGSIVISQCETMADLLKEYISMYGKNNWALSTYTSNINMINAYILPHLGQMKLGDITARSLEKYYQTMLKTRAVPKCTDNKHKKTSALVSAETVRRIHKLRHSCFEQAVRWDLMIRNPADYATVPKSTKKQREIWNAETLMRAVELCGDSKLRLAINLAFACSLRIGELLGLTWSCIDVSDESIKKGVAYVYVNKELQRVNRSAMQQLDEKDVIFAFPVVFHSLRHSSITYKLKLNGGDIKAVQGDSGHAQAKMVTDQYSHILDDDRQQNAKLFEKAFYRKDIVREDAGEHLPAAETKTGDALTAGDRQLLEKLMSDESTATLLMNLLKKLS